MRSCRTYLLRVVALLAVQAGVLPASHGLAQIEFDREPILYSSAPVDDPIARLQKRIDAGETTLEFDQKHGYLPAVLKELGVSPSSQTLVFSKTSFQLRFITPRTPRAVYFNDTAYVGWVQRGDVVELAGVDPRQGAIFYVLEQEQQEKPKFIRDTGNCLTCHASSRTHDVPGYLVRSVYPSSTGMPHFGAGGFRTNHASPLRERWGGWYVTGEHGDQRHMGNVVTDNKDRPEQLNVEAGANLTSLAGKFRTEPYLSAHSDIVALMVLEHQGDMHNLIARASYETRMASHQSQVMNEALGRPKETLSESAERRIASAAEQLVEYMLFVDEAPLEGQIEGTTSYAEEFAALGPTDSKGRSLRQFDLRKRLFKHPCSYLIYSEAFEALPAAVKDRVYRRLWEVLSGQDQSERYARLSPEDRQAVLEILRETKPSLPAYWREGA